MYTIFQIFLGFFLGFVIANFVEWNIHKYVLHAMGKKKGSYWRAHWSRHHKRTRKGDYVDTDYQQPFWFKHRQAEVLGLALIVLCNAPFAALLLIWWPIFSISYFLTIIGYVFLYYFIHKYSHINAAWGKKWIPWHYDHHRGRDQDQNWNVVFPLWDYILGTRIKYKYDSNGKVIK